LQLSRNPVACELVKRTGGPIAAASANIWGKVCPTCIEHVKADLGDALEAFIDDGPCTIGIESTIVSFLDEEPIMLRLGAIPRDKIEEVIGPLLIVEKATNTQCFQCLTYLRDKQSAVMLFEDQVEHISKDLRTGLISFRPVANTEIFNAVEVLSEKGCLEESARNLFAAIRRLDALDLDLIVVQRVPEKGLGITINDRLARVCF
jgi:L-threonylcarbamoyladenylate synthase